MRIVSPLMSFPDPSMDVARLTPSAAVTAAQAALALRTCFGLSGQLDRLPGEADDNFALRTGDGRRYVVKFAHLRADPEVVSVQVRVLKHIESVAAGLPVPRVVPTGPGRSAWVRSGGASDWPPPEPGPPLAAGPATRSPVRPGRSAVCWPKSQARSQGRQGRGASSASGTIALSCGS